MHRRKPLRKNCVKQKCPFNTDMVRNSKPAFCGLEKIRIYIKAFKSLDSWRNFR